jgi:hypothetical protein
MRNRVLCVLSIALLALAGGLAAQGTDPAATTQTITGTVVSSSSSSLVIDTDTGTRQTFMVDAQSTLPTGLAPGTRISVDYHSLAGGTFHAARATTLGAAAPIQPTTEARPMDTTTPPDTTTSSSMPSTDSSTGAAPATRTKTRKMPATASPLPLVALIGLASLAGAATLRRFAYR